MMKSEAYHLLSLLEDYCPKSEGHDVAIEKDHPIYLAVQAIEAGRADHKLPYGWRRPWREMLVAARAGDQAAYGHADDLHEIIADWLESQGPRKNRTDKRPTVNQRMAEAIQRDPLLAEWPASKWAVKMGCTASAVKKTDAWRKTIAAWRATFRVDKIAR